MLGRGPQSDAAGAVGPTLPAAAWRPRRALRGLLLASAWAALAAPSVYGQDDPPPAPDQAAATAPVEGAAEGLSDKQRQIAEKYERLEQILLRMSELTAGTDPRRAALLKKVVAESKQRLIDVQLASLVDLLAKDQLSRAIEGQESLDNDFHEILALLLSENRAERIESEKARIREYLKQLNQIITRQKGLQARTSGGAGEPAQLSKEQGDVGERTDSLADDIRRNEEPETESDENGQDARDGRPTEGEAGPPSSAEQSPPGDAKSGEGGESGERSEDQPPSEPSERGSAEPGKTPPSPPDEGRAEESGEQQEPEPSGNAHPARQRLDEARRRMREAQRRLDEAQRDGAAGEQEEAIRQLEQAKAELEEILRQLREEEIEQMLVALEARLVRMLQMQREVYDGTERLETASAGELSHEQAIEAGRLSSREAEIVAEADRALVLLREDGTAVAFPEALSQARDDMQQVVARLAQAKVGQITLELQADILLALEEMLEAVRKAIEDAEQRRSQSEPAQPGMPEDPALVDLLSELKMIRALQMRVNTRTDYYGKMISGAHAESPELLDALRRLADRQERVYQITRDLQTGKNQ